MAQIRLMSLSLTMEKKKTKFLERLFESSHNYSKKIKIRCGIMAIEENKAFFPVNTPNNKL